MQPASPAPFGTELDDPQATGEGRPRGHDEVLARTGAPLARESEGGAFSRTPDELPPQFERATAPQSCPVAVVVIGASTGELAALCTILSGLRRDFPAPVVVAQRRWAGGRGRHLSVLRQIASLDVKEAQGDERIRPGIVYVAPPDVHVLVGPEGILSLSHGPLVNESRPSTYRLFSSAAGAFGSRVVGVMLGLPREDDVEAAHSISSAGGTVVIEEPSTAKGRASLQPDLADVALPAWKIAPMLARVTGQRRSTQLWRVASPLIRRRRPPIE